MKSLKLIGSLIAVAILYGSTVAFSPIKKSADTKNIIFETNDINEVKRVKDLLTKENLEQVKGFHLVRINVTVKNKNEGTTIDIGGGA